MSDDGLTPIELAKVRQARDALQEWWEWAERELKEVDDLFRPRLDGEILPGDV